MPRVLIVDDSPTEIFQISNVLTRNGYDIVTAASAEQGLKMAREQMPDLVLMDIVMPGLNGYQATRQLSRDPQTGAIPVIILTTKNQETDRVWGERQGAKGFLTKPVDEALLVATMKRVLAEAGR